LSDLFLGQSLVSPETSEPSHSSCVRDRALERECGYILLGALIHCWGSGSLPMAGIALPLPQLVPSKPTARTCGRTGAATEEIAPAAVAAANLAAGGKQPAAQVEEVVQLPKGEGDAVGGVLDLLLLALGDAARSDLDDQK
jgi:hypothetical protein